MARIEELLRRITSPELRVELTAEVARLESRAPKGLVFEKHDTEPGGPIYPTLRSVETVDRGGDRERHLVINGENRHALELLEYTSAGTVDLIYIDPPYNTGKRTWKYNNDYVDRNDRWKHSRWLSFMDTRLRLARRLLKPGTGTLVVAIDDHEHAHLVMLLEQLFRGWDLTTVCVVHNPRGQQGSNFSSTHEYAVFAIPPGAKVIGPRPLGSAGRGKTGNLRKWGNFSTREEARNCFYPIHVRAGVIVGFGDVAPKGFHPKAAVTKHGRDTVAVWPIDEKGVERKWRYARDTVERIREQLVVKQARNGDLAIHLAKETGAYRTVWQDPKFDASVYGKQLVTKFGGADFPYPKSLYSVYDVLHAVTAQNPDASIVDFFGGSGTTLHATLLLNATDRGRRRCILVTNNEVEASKARELAKRGVSPGDDEFERHGIFRSVTLPRLRGAVTGKTPEGKPLEGQYLGGRDYALGFDENVEFLSLELLDPAELGERRKVARLDRALRLVAGARLADRKVFMPRHYLEHFEKSPASQS